MPGVRVVEVGPRLELYVGGRRRIGPALRFGAGVFRHLLRHGRRYDVVHCASTPFFALHAAGLARRRGRYRLLVDWIEVWTRAYWRAYLGRLGGTIAWAIQRLAARFGEHAFCYSRLHERRLRAEGFAGPVDVIGVYTGPLGRPEPEPAEPSSSSRAGTSRRRACSRSRPRSRWRGRPCRTCAARSSATGRSGPRSSGGAGRGWTEASRCRASSTRPSVRDAVRRSLCLVLPSTREGYGLVVVEAASLGTPGVVVDAPDNAALELVEDGVNGVVARSAQPEDLAEAILRVRELGPALRESTADWFERNAERLSLERSVATVLGAYGVGEGRRQPAPPRAGRDRRGGDVRQEAAPGALRRGSRAGADPVLRRRRRRTRLGDERGRRPAPLRPAEPGPARARGADLLPRAVRSAAPTSCTTSSTRRPSLPQSRR